MQCGLLYSVFIVNLLCSLTVTANEVGSNTYLFDWLKNSEHYAQEKIMLEEHPDAIISTPTQSTQAAQKIVAVLNAVRKQETKHPDQETINALEAGNLIASKDGSTQKTALAKLCQHASPTLLGKISLADMLVHSSPDLELIRSRQEIIKILYENDALRTTLIGLKDAYANKLESMHMFESPSFRDSIHPVLRWIDAKLLCKCPKALLFVFLQLENYAEEMYLCCLLAGFSSYSLTFKTAYKQCFNSELNMGSDYKGMSELNMGSDYKGMAKRMIADIAIDALANSLIARKPDSVLYNIYKKYTQPDKRLASCLDFCSYNRHVVNFCLQLRALSEQYSEIKKIKSLSYLNDFEQKIKTDSVFKQFVDLLKKDPQRLWQYEQTLLIKLAHTYQHELVGLYALAGETEAYLAIAQSKKRFDGHDNLKMAFTEFTNGGDAKLEMKNVWNPSLDDEKAIPNSLVFSDVAKNHKILTGSNMGGKSTLIKAVIANLLLSQTFGVAFAQEMKHQPVDQLLVSLNIADNTGRESLFEAEINRAAHILAVLRSNPQKNSLILCDELFVGTSSTDAGLAAKTVALEIAKANAASIFATHHGKVVTDLGTAAHTSFANIKMDAVQDEQGRTTYTYQCKDGISQENIARKLFEERIGVPMATE